MGLYFSLHNGMHMKKYMVYHLACLSLRIMIKLTDGVTHKNEFFLSDCKGLLMMFPFKLFTIDIHYKLYASLK